jgi:hypothetical protein
MYHRPRDDFNSFLETSEPHDSMVSDGGADVRAELDSEPAPASCAALYPAAFRRADARFDASQV